MFSVSVLLLYLQIISHSCLPRKIVPLQASPDMRSGKPHTGDDAVITGHVGRPLFLRYVMYRASILTGCVNDAQSGTYFCKNATNRLGRH